MHPIAPSTEVPWWAYVAFFTMFLAVVLFARNRDVEDAQRLLENGWSARAVGLVVIALAVGAAYILAYAPILDALTKQRLIMIRYGAMSVPGVVVYVGLVLLAAGRHSPKFFIVRPGERFTVLQWGTIAVGIAIALTLELGVMRFLAARGYTPHL
jgi:hypothetical protein